MKTSPYKRKKSTTFVIQNSEVLIVVPAYNESATIAQVVQGIHSIGFSCVVIDDGSEDSTPLVAKHAGAVVLTLPFNVGVGGALRCGFRYAVEKGFTAVIQCDADGQHQSHHFQDLIRTANETNADFVLGSRFLSSANTMDPHIVRRFAMWWLARVASRATGRKITDSTSGFRLIRRPLLDELAEHLPEYYLGDTFETLVVLGRAGYTVEEIGTAMSPRQSGVSSASNGRAVLLIGKALMTVLLGLQFRITKKSQ
jgi:glycosyltransferase involved in cell wall biosynthesis